MCPREVNFKAIDHAIPKNGAITSIRYKTVHDVEGLLWQSYLDLVEFLKTYPL